MRPGILSGLGIPEPCVSRTVSDPTNVYPNIPYIFQTWGFLHKQNIQTLQSSPFGSMPCSNSPPGHWFQSMTSERVWSPGPPWTPCAAVWRPVLPKSQVPLTGGFPLEEGTWPNLTSQRTTAYSNLMKDCLYKLSGTESIMIFSVLPLNITSSFNPIAKPYSQGHVTLRTNQTHRVKPRNRYGQVNDSKAPCHRGSNRECGAVLWERTLKKFSSHKPRGIKEDVTVSSIT